MTTQEQPVAGVRDLCMYFGGVHALEEISLDIPSKKLTGIIGPNGSGKTTLLNVLSRMITQTSGSLSFLGEDTTSVGAERVTAMGMARTFQGIRLVPTLTVLENVMLGADLAFRIQRRRPFVSGDKWSRAWAHEVLELVDIADLARVRPGALPYGFQRKVEIARALASKPSLLLLDEPTAGMNAREREEISELLLKLRDRGLSQLLVEHDVHMMTSICDHLIAFDFGRKVAEGKPLEVIADAGVRESYLGQVDP